MCMEEGELNGKMKSLSASIRFSSLFSVGTVQIPVEVDRRCPTNFTGFRYNAPMI